MLMSRRKQSGMSLFSLVLVALLMALAALWLVKLTGPYWQQFKLDSHLSQVADELRGRNPTEAVIERRLDRFLNQENIDLDPAAIIQLNQNDASVQLVLDYEKRIDIFGNIDVILSFHEEYGL
ncbi:hypothetical protein BGP77_09175 [Saccharospirillum sp. MSK14-1]|uniref:DUF4845 domain-containing protein n=1 Tax=Saccharospirillum sp. MSK14-1 TaxID=1897632 RepID=UPI000D3BA63E|nr:DUF4845 domain-containing protein [Saccharospirillum sp. MSK14-1]PTY38919.1 hypothetical protein BGP77_09175 [Saccharospirillum sp. MSK14-1]